ncbi:MAG: hypothetical protein PF545_04445 [Elusimicrobia bacterium]|nr:hypothetical protein [Elusimicrobiota bacterium]
MIILRTIGHLINSILLFIIVVSAARIAIEAYTKDIMEVPVGPLVKEISDIIMEYGRKFLPFDKQKNLLLGISMTSFILIIIIRAVIKL